MSIVLTDVIGDLQSRGLVSQLAGGDELVSHLMGASRTVYSGFDPTAESLHIGHLVPLLALKRFQMAGHKPIALVGGATGMIGDPSFKAAERQLNSTEIIEQWVVRIKSQVSQFLDFECGENSATVVNNLDWIKDYDVLSFLRDVGKHFSVNAMIQKESVKQRIDRDDAGISFTEFTYMILQSYDFAELNKRYGCTLQVGGSDQWGNITGGIDLTRRMYQHQVYGVTTPLITKSDGTKFGKTESGSVWISPDKTSPYAFYQFWLNVADTDVYNFLNYFTFLPVSETKEIEASDQVSNSRPEAQGILAQNVTELVHGAQGLKAATRISHAMFSGDIQSLTLADLQQLELDGLPCTDLIDKPYTIVEALVATELAKSNRMAREFIGSNAISVNGQVVSSAEFELNPALALEGKYFVLRRGKKMFHLVKISD
ncbi:MAG: tyrosine--tRNA ligase [Gammaproteobacteria bacterium]|nr:tyrosine--tRNA ligase [Gammaproteobacteria bacterium]